MSFSIFYPSLSDQVADVREILEEAEREFFVG